MVNDKLAEFNGIKPNFTLAEGEEKVVKSRSIGLTYTIKRNAEHFYCTCPAWRNQIGVPINARSCKHFLSLLGEQYEEARLECMNPGGPPPKGLLSVQRPKAQNPEKTRSVSQKISSDKPSSESSSLKAQASLKPVSNSASANTAIVSTNPMSAYSSQPIPTSAATTQKGEISSSGLLNVIEAKVQAKKREREKQGKRNMVDDDDMMDMAEDEDDKMDEVGGPDEDFDMEEDDENYDEDEKFKSRKHKPFSSASSTIKKTPVKRKRADRSPDSDDDEKDVIQSKMKFTAKSSSSTQKRTSPASAKRPAKRRNDVPETQDDDDNRDKDEEPDKPRKRTTTKTSSSSKEKSPAKKPNKPKEAVSETEDDSDEEEQESKARGKEKFQQKPASSKAKVPATPSSKPSSKKRARKALQSETEDDDDDDDQANARKPSSSKRPAPKGKPAYKRQKIEEEEENDEDEQKDEDEDDGNDADHGGDELASIQGVKPSVLMKDGEEKEVQSQTSSSTYKVKRTMDHYYCTCPAWRNQPSVPVNARSCKHLIALLGEKYEAARIKLKNPNGAALRSPNKKSSGSKKGKKAGGDDSNGDSSKIDVAVLLANSWDVDKGPDPTGWWISEKLDGVRTLYDGSRFYSRLGNPFTPPQWFLDKLPKDVTLDGELFGGRGEFQNTVSIVKTMNSPHWKGITFHIFDIPSLSTQPFEARMERLKKLFAPGIGSHASDNVLVVEQEKAKSRQHVLDKLKEVESLGGEGLMLRMPGSLYEGKRSSTLLKIKSFYDAEAVVTGYKAGKGRNAGVTGALKCKMASGKTFDVGSGLNDKQRKSPPKIGSIIVYRFQELTKDGVPRFPTYLGEAVDKNKPKDAVVPDHRKAVVKKDDA